MAADALTNRQLGRATLARQLLLRRAAGLWHEGLEASVRLEALAP